MLVLFTVLMWSLEYLGYTTGRALDFHGTASGPGLEKAQRASAGRSSAPRHLWD